MERFSACLLWNYRNLRGKEKRLFLIYINNFTIFLKKRKNSLVLQSFFENLYLYEHHPGIERAFCTM